MTSFSPGGDADRERRERERERTPAALVEVDQQEMRAEQRPEQRRDVRHEEVALRDVEAAEREQERSEARDLLRAREPPREEEEHDDRQHAVEHAPRAAEQDQGPIGRHEPRARVGRCAEVPAGEPLLREHG